MLVIEQGFRLLVGSVVHCVKRYEGIKPLKGARGLVA